MKRLARVCEGTTTSVRLGTTLLPLRPKRGPATTRAGRDARAARRPRGANDRWRAAPRLPPRRRRRARARGRREEQCDGSSEHRVGATPSPCGKSSRRSAASPAGATSSRSVRSPTPRVTRWSSQPMSQSSQPADSPRVGLSRKGSPRLFAGGPTVRADERPEGDDRDPDTEPRRPTRACAAVGTRTAGSRRGSRRVGQRLYGRHTRALRGDGRSRWTTQGASARSRHRGRAELPVRTGGRERLDVHVVGGRRLDRPGLRCGLRGRARRASRLRPGLWTRPLLPGGLVRILRAAGEPPVRILKDQVARVLPHGGSQRPVLWRDAARAARSNADSPGPRQRLAPSRRDCLVREDPNDRGRVDPSVVRGRIGRPRQPRSSVRDSSVEGMAPASRRRRKGLSRCLERPAVHRGQSTRTTRSRCYLRCGRGRALLAASMVALALAKFGRLEHARRRLEERRRSRERLSPSDGEGSPPGST